MVRSILRGALAAVLLTGACSAPPTPPPSPSPTVAPSRSPSPTLSAADIERQIAEIEAAVAPLRGLAPQEPVPNRILDAVALRAELLHLIDEAATPAEYAAQSRFGERLGLLPVGSDLRTLQLDLLDAQVLGFYDSDTGEMTLVQRQEAFGPLDRLTLAHEYTHALQDQHFDLDSLGTDDLSNGDRSLARVALVEGDASLLMQQWALANLSLAEAMKVFVQALDPRQQAAMAGMPPILQRQLTFPYFDGLAFVTGLQSAGGWGAVDAAYSRPPDSTEQVLHPEKYAAGEGPVTVPAPGELQRLGPGWTETLSDTLGELSISVWLEPTAGAEGAAAAAAGWGGDRVTMYERPDGAWLIAWTTAWDTPEDEAEFAAAAQGVAGARRVDANRPGSPYNYVVVALASDRALLGRLYPPTR